MLPCIYTHVDNYLCHVAMPPWRCGHASMDMWPCLCGDVAIPQQRLLYASMQIFACLHTDASGDVSIHMGECLHTKITTILCENILNHL